MAAESAAMGSSDTMPISRVEIVMVAERAVQQGLLDLRAELGVKFQGIDSGLQAVQSFLSKLKELDENFENLSDNVTEAFKNNNALLRTEIKAMSGDIAQSAQNERVKTKEENAAIIEQLIKSQNENTKKQIDELEKNINIALENIKQNNMNMGGNRDRNETNDDRDFKGNKYGFNKDWKLEPTEKWSDNNLSLIHI